MTFVVLVQRGKYETRAIGPYRSFKAAENDSKAWHGTDGRTTQVVPIESADKYLNEGP